MRWRGDHGGLVRGLVRWSVVLVGVLTIGGYAVVGCVVNKQPSVERFGGWIALVQRTDDLSAAQVALSGTAMVSGGTEGPSSVRVTVRACGDAFNGVLLLGGSARLDSLHVFDEQGREVEPGKTTELAFSQSEQVWELGEVQQVPVYISEIDCVPDTDGVVAGHGVQVTGQTAASLRTSPSVLGLTGARSSFVWPLTGGLPGVPAANKGEFTALRGMEGEWIIPPRAVNEVDLGALSGAALVEGVIPPLADTAKLKWSSPSPLQPVVRLTNVVAAAELQQWLVPLGILLGVTGSILASMLFEWVKQRPRPTRDEEPQPPPSVDASFAPHRPVESMAGRQTVTRTRKTITVTMIAGLVGYLIGRRLRR